MVLFTSPRGFEVITHPKYDEDDNTPVRLVQQSSAIGSYDDSWDKPGSSFLWIGEHHHLNREEVAQLVEHLQSWLATGRLELSREVSK